MAEEKQIAFDFGSAPPDVKDAALTVSEIEKSRSNCCSCR